MNDEQTLLTRNVQETFTIGRLKAQIVMIDSQIANLSTRRQALVDEINKAIIDNKLIITPVI